MVKAWGAPCCICEEYSSTLKKPTSSNETYRVVCSIDDSDGKIMKVRVSMLCGDVEGAAGLASFRILQGGGSDKSPEWAAYKDACTPEERVCMKYSVKEKK